MTEQSPEERRKAAYEKLAEVVQELSDLDETEPGCPPSMPTAWVLIVGYEAFSEELAGMSGSTGIYPKGGCQPQWKTAGIIHQASSRMGA